MHEHHTLMSQIETSLPQLLKQSLVRHRAAAFVRTAMTEQHRAFWPLLPLFYVGTVAADGRPWASALAGPPGFVSAPNTRTLQMSTKPAFGGGQPPLSCFQRARVM